MLIRKWMKPIPCFENDPPVIESPGLEYQKEDNHQPEDESAEVISQKRPHKRNRVNAWSEDSREMQE